MAYNSSVVILETRALTRLIEAFLSAEEYREFQLELVSRPDVGALIKGTGGLRKLRWGGSGRGKRGGVRVIYYHYVAGSRILLLFAFAKNERSDLTPRQRETLRKIVEEEYP